MKFFKKKGVAIAVLVLAILASSVIGISKRPVKDPAVGPELDTSLSTAYLKNYVVDEADVFSKETEDLPQP